jgi:hypothetical protein
MRVFRRRLQLDAEVVAAQKAGVVLSTEPDDELPEGV